MAKESPEPQIVCVALNPAVDRTLEVPGLTLGEHLQGRLLSRQPAGKAVNVARLLQNLGRGCILTGFIGEGERAMFESSFDSKIVRSQLFGVASATRESITLVDPEVSGETHIRVPGEAISEEDQERLTKKLKILAKPGVWMVFAGSLPPGISPEKLHDILKTVTDKKARVVFDSSQGALDAVRKLPVWLVKPNRAELAELTGLPTDTPEAVVRAAWSLRDAAEIVLVSAGEDGAYLVESSSIRHARVRELPKRVTNTVGSGDALLAGFLAARARGLGMPECLQRAVAAGTSACFHLRTGELDVAEADSLLPQVEVNELSPD